MVLASVAKFGFIADLISKPTMIGYMNGLALTILVGQLPKLFGFKVEADGLIGESAAFLGGLAEGKAVIPAAAVGIVGIALVLVLERRLPKVPAVLVMVVPAIAATTPHSGRRRRRVPRRNRRPVDRGRPTPWRRSSHVYGITHGG